jgi:hypothetical protein
MMKIGKEIMLLSNALIVAKFLSLVDKSVMAKEIVRYAVNPLGIVIFLERNPEVRPV